MKIGFVIGSLKYSGAEKIARYLTESFATQGHNVSVLLLGEQKPCEDITGIKQIPLFITGNRYTRFLKRQKAIRETVEKEKFDVVVSFGVVYNLDVMEALKNVRIPVILCERNDPYTDPHRKILRLRRNLIYKKATGYVFQTERIADFFGKEIKSRSIVIPNFIEKRYEKTDTQNNENIIVITARLAERQKNISMLLRVFKKFSLNHDYKLYIVGDGPDRAMYEKYIKENHMFDKVILTGRQNVIPYLEKAKFFVLTSNYEGMPNSLIEAMAMGLPCVSTDCSGGGAAALIDDGINGILIPVNNEDKLFEAMTKIADDGEMRTKLADEAYKINETLEINKIISMWKNYIEEIAEGGKK